MAVNDQQRKNKFFRDLVDKRMPLPKAKRKIPGQFVEGDKYDHPGRGGDRLLEAAKTNREIHTPEEYVAALSKAALERSTMSLPNSIRQQYDGNVTHTMLDGKPVLHVAITLTHKRTVESVTAEVEIHLDDIKRALLGAARAKGMILGNELVELVKEQQTGITRRSEEKKEKRREEKEEKRKELFDCVICGEVNDEFPEWGQCEHTKAERKGT